MAKATLKTNKGKGLEATAMPTPSRKITKTWAASLVAMKAHGIALEEEGQVDSEELRQAIIERMATDERREKIPEWQAAGLSQRDMAKLAGVSNVQIHKDIVVLTGLTKTVNRVNTGNGSTTRALLSQSDQNDWRTPRKYLEAAHAVMGGIDLDPASSTEANETVKAAAFYTETDNGLEKPWKGRVWLNPPYGGEARLFVERLLKEYQVGNVTAAILLVNSHPTETKWFQQLFDYTVCFVAGRIDFGGPSRDVASTSTHGSALVYLGSDIEKFKQTFGGFGAVVRKYDLPA
jgi:phage N-6-adenine-methyltransferase